MIPVSSPRRIPRSLQASNGRRFSTRLLSARISHLFRRCSRPVQHGRHFQVRGTYIRYALTSRYRPGVTAQPPNTQPLHQFGNMAPRIATLSWLVGLLILPLWIYGKPLSATRGAVEDTYDFVIIGGGTAGLTVGDRLSGSGSGKCKYWNHNHLTLDCTRNDRVIAVN